MCGGADLAKTLKCFTSLLLCNCCENCYAEDNDDRFWMRPQPCSWSETPNTFTHVSTSKTHDTSQQCNPSQSCRPEKNPQHHGQHSPPFTTPQHPHLSKSHRVHTVLAVSQQPSIAENYPEHFGLASIRPPRVDESCCLEDRGVGVAGLVISSLHHCNRVVVGMQAVEKAWHSQPHSKRAPEKCTGALFVFSDSGATDLLRRGCFNFLWVCPESRPSYLLHVLSCELVLGQVVINIQSYIQDTSICADQAQKVPGFVDTCGCLVSPPFFLWILGFQFYKGHQGESLWPQENRGNGKHGISAQFPPQVSPIFLPPLSPSPLFFSHCKSCSYILHPDLVMIPHLSRFPPCSPT